MAEKRISRRRIGATKVHQATKKVGKTGLEGVGFRRESIVKRKRLLEGDDYYVDFDERVASYDPNKVKTYFDNRDSRQIGLLEALKNRSYRQLKHNIIGNTAIILIIYLALWLAFHFVFARIPGSIFTNTTLCTNTTSQEIAYLEEPNCANLIRSKVIKFIDDWSGHEKEMQKVLCLLLGFYVKTIIGRWRNQTSKLPSLEEVCQAINGFVLHEDETKQGQFKRKIARYCLLSWTMCLTSVSSMFKKEFEDEEEYMKKGLMTENEFRMLMENTNCKNKKGGGGWTDQWHVPLGWATLLANEGAVGEDVYIKKEHKFICKMIGNIQSKLEGIIEHFHNPVPTIMTQAVTVACWGFLICSVVSGQEVEDVKHAGNFPLGISFFTDLPYLHFVKIILLFAWLRVGMYLQNPFEYEDGFGIDLEQRLDVEIWKSSYMMSPKYLPPSLNEY